MKYSLAIEWKPNNYLPIEWWTLSSFNISSRDDLSAIDAFTTTISEKEFKFLLTSEFGYDANKKIVINFFEQGQIRELDFGPCFSDKSLYLNKNYIMNILLQNRNNKVFMNRIYNEFNKMVDKSPAFRDLISSLNRFDAENINAFSNIHYIDYSELRTLGMFLCILLEPEVKKTNKNTNNNVITPGNIVIKKELTNKEG